MLPSRQVCKPTDVDDKYFATGSRLELRVSFMYFQTKAQSFYHIFQDMIYDMVLTYNTMTFDDVVQLHVKNIMRLYLDIQVQLSLFHY